MRSGGSEGRHNADADAHEGDVEKEMGLWQAVKKTSKYATSACT